MKALVLIDFQKEWLASASPYFVGDIDDVIEKVNRLLSFARYQGYKIIFTQHMELDNPSGWFGKQNTNTALISELDVHPKDTIIVKHKISPFYQTTMEEELSGVDEVIVCGLLTNLCVRSFVHDAYDRDFAITLIQDCCVALDEEIHEFTLEDLQETRKEIEVVDFEDVVE